MSEFKAGDLALVINDDRYPQNIGLCVQLSEFVQPDGEYWTPDGRHVENGSGEAVWVVVADGLTSSTGSGYCQKVERNLMPLRGDFQPDQEMTREVPA